MLKLEAALFFQSVDYMLQVPNCPCMRDILLPEAVGMRHVCHAKLLIGTYVNILYSLKMRICD